MPGKKRGDRSGSDDVGQIRIMVEGMRAENRLTAESIETFARQQSLEMRALEARLNDRFEILETVGRSHGAELKVLRTDVGGLKTDVSGLKADVSGLKEDVARLTTDVRQIDGKVDKLLTLDARVSALERRSS
jgi:hypothetical protein